MQLTSPEINSYCEAHTTDLSPLFQKLREETYAKTTAPNMQVGKIEGSLLRMLVAITNAKNILELGTFTGFSALAMAEALPADGKLITCDIDEKNTSIAREYWSMSPHGEKIELKIGSALDTLKKITSESQDIIFIDADKANYTNYWELCVPLLKKNALLIVDNVLWSGRVLNPQESSDHHIAAFNEHAKKDSRVEVLMLPVRDGILLARKI